MADWYMKVGDLRPSLQGKFVGPDGVTPVDLTGATVTFAMRPKDRSVAATGGDCEIVGAPTNGDFLYDWAAPDTAVAGSFDAEITAVDYAGKPLTLPNGEPTRAMYIEIEISPRIT